MVPPASRSSKSTRSTSKGIAPRFHCRAQGARLGWLNEVRSKIARKARDWPPEPTFSDAEDQVSTAAFCQLSTGRKNSYPEIQRWAWRLPFTDSLGALRMRPLDGSCLSRDKLAPAVRLMARDLFLRGERIHPGSGGPGSRQQSIPAAIFLPASERATRAACREQCSSCHHNDQRRGRRSGIAGRRLSSARTQGLPWACPCSQNS